MSKTKATKILGVLVFMAGLSYGVYEGVSNSPTVSYFYNRISDSSLLENIDFSSVTKEKDFSELKEESEDKNPIDSIVHSPTPVANLEENIESESKETKLSEPTQIVDESEELDVSQTVDDSTSDIATDQQEDNISIKDDAVQVASSHGLNKVSDYDAATKADVFSDNGSITSRPTTFVEGENPEYIKELWNNSIAIKHRRYWNLAPIDHESWEKQFALVKKRFYVHAQPNDREVMYGSEFGNFTINESKAQIKEFDYKEFEKNPNNRMYYLNAKNLANICYYQLSLTPWGTWFKFGRKRYWSLLWDFCAKDSVREKGIPGNYWYHNKGERSEKRFDDLWTELEKSKSKK